MDVEVQRRTEASALGHESFKTTAETYAKREAVAGAQQKQALAVLSTATEKFRSAFVELNGIDPSASSMPFRGEPKKNQ